MSAVIWSLHRAVAMRARILTWAAPTTVQKHCPKSTRMPRSGLPRVFVCALACTSMQTFGGRCSCTSSVRSAAVFSSCAATVEPSLLRGTAQRHRNGPAWASNDALSKALARTRVPQHLAPRTPDYWAPTHTFVEPGHERLPLES